MTHTEGKGRMNYVGPEYKKEHYTCPHCNVVAHQEWPGIKYNNSVSIPAGSTTSIDNLDISRCFHCKGYVLWVGRKIAWPYVGTAPLVNDDTPESVKQIYLEARNIVNDSPRGAAALLRLSLQVLMKELGEPGKDLNKDIGSLVKKGLLPQVQKALDAVRVIGNEAVHPGVIDLSDDKLTVSTLFLLVNSIVDQMITRHKVADAIYELLPADKREGINLRDKG